MEFAGLVCFVFLHYIYKININYFSWIPCTTKTVTQGCGVGLPDTKLNPFIDITFFDTKTQKTKLST